MKEKRFEDVNLLIDSLEEFAKANGSIELLPADDLKLFEFGWVDVASGFRWAVKLNILKDWFCSDKRDWGSNKPKEIWDNFCKTYEGKIAFAEALASRANKQKGNKSERK